MSAHKFDGNVTFFSMDAVSPEGTSPFGRIVDREPSPEDQVHSVIRHDAVGEIIAEMTATDPILAEVLVRRLGLGGWPAESNAAIARSIEESADGTQRLFDRALAEFELHAQFHRHNAYLQMAA
jgi:hypothetical protein